MLSSIQIDPRIITNIDDLIARDHLAGQFRPTAVAVVQRESGNLMRGREVLFLRSAKSEDSWNFLQGGIEPGEKVIAGLFRELAEEVTIPSVLVQSCAFCLRSEIRVPGKVLRDGFNSGKSYYYFGLRCLGKPQVRLNLAEVCDHKWLPLAEAVTFIGTLKKRDTQKRTDMLFALQKALLA